MSTSFGHTVAANRPAQATQDATACLAATPIPLRHLLVLTIGFAGTLVFPIIYIIEGATRPGYHAMRDTISSLSFGPTGWVQQVNFALCGIGILVMALAWRQILAGGVCATWYPIVRGVEGAALIAVGIFTLDPWHTAFMMVILNAMSLGLLVITRRFWKRSLWRGWAAFSLVCGLWPMIVMPLFGVALSGHGALSGYAGLFERLATNSDTVWSLALIARLWTRRSIGI